MSEYKLKITFSKQESVKYISHLDFVRMFQRAFKRAGIMVSHSQGFNPHPKMTFLMPLSVGFTSECEELIIELDEKIEEIELIKRLMENLPVGVLVSSVCYLSFEEKKQRISRAKYRICCEISGNMDFDADRFLSNAQIIIDKKTKSGTKETDIKPDIFGISIVDKTENKLCFEAELACGDTNNLNPKFLLDAIEKYTDGLKVDYALIHRVYIK